MSGPVMMAAALAGAPAIARAQAAHSPPYLITGLFFAAIEEGARIFTPTRLLPLDHPEALGHQFPTVLQFHGCEDQLLVLLGQQAGLRLATTLQRYPTEPDTLWPYQPFSPPPVDAFRSAAAVVRPAGEAPLPGLRAVAYLDRVPLAFIVDTRGLTLAERRMERTTSMGLDVSRAELLAALATAAGAVPAVGATILVYRRTPSH